MSSKTTEPTAYYERLPIHARDETQRMLAAMHEDGFVMLPGIVPPKQIEEARRHIDLLKKLPWDFMGLTDHYKNVFNRDPFWVPFLDLPGVIDVAEASLGKQCHIIGQTAWRSHPGHHGVGLHLDYIPMQWPEPGVPAGFNVPMFLCTAHIYLSPQHAKLCPTHIIPGSHRAGRRPGQVECHWNNRLPQPVLCDAGDVLFFRSDLWHSGSDNLTADEVRYLLQVHYGKREMAQHFAPYLSWKFDPDVLAACNARQLRLLGDHPQGSYD